VTADAARPLLIVDAANVVGSVPDGWWRNRRAAAERLRDSLSKVAEGGLSGHPELSPPLDVLLVVEGAARGVPPIEGVQVHSARGSGDDAIVALVREEIGRRPMVAVVTADRGLRARVTALGARVLGPRTLPYPD
jgi:hypothetical protein